MKRNNKKGFTIVELVIVIAIIAILAAVLIPTFSNLIKRANVSKDQQLVRNLNTALIADKAINGKHETMYSALQAVADSGFDVAKINDKKASDNEILWDSVSDVFCYRNGNNIEYIPEAPKNGKVKDYQYWIIASEPSETYSTYLYKATEETFDNVTTGLDVGNENVTSITYNRTTGDPQTVVIRTNGGTLTVNAKDDNVLHYGYADSVNVIDVATASYHENGTVKFLEVAAGHIVLEKESDVSAVHFTATNGAFKNAENKTISIDLSKVNTEDISFSRDAVTIADNGTYVAEVTTESTEYIWLFGNGIKEQMVSTTTEGAIAENGTLKTGITAGAEDGSVAEQIANPAKRNAEGQLVAADGETVVTAENAVVEEVASKESVQTGATLFAGGTGTESDPYKISTSFEMTNIDLLYQSYNYFELVSDLDLASWNSIRMNGCLEGNNHKITSLSSRLFSGTYSSDDNDFIIKNLDITCNIQDYSGNLGYFVCLVYPGSGSAETIRFENVDAHGFITGTTVSTYLGYGANVRNVYFTNCESDVTLQSGTCAGFVCHVVNSNITINDSKYTGKMYYTSSNNKYFTTNWNNNVLTLDYSDNYDVSNLASDSTNLNSAKYIYDATSYASGSLTAVEKGQTYTVSKANGATYAVAQIIIGARGADGKPNYTGVYVTDDNLEPDNNQFTTINVKNYNITVNSGATSGLNGNTFNVVNSAYGTIVDSAVVVITQYSQSGTIIRTDSISIK